MTNSSIVYILDLLTFGRASNTPGDVALVPKSRIWSAVKYAVKQASVVIKYLEVYWEHNWVAHGEDAINGSGKIEMMY